MPIIVDDSESVLRNTRRIFTHTVTKRLSFMLLLRRYYIELAVASTVKSHTSNNSRVFSQLFSPRDHKFYIV